MTPLLCLSQLSRRIGDRVLFENLSLELLQGEHLAVMGPSGCGKTTLLRTIAGLEAPDRGTVAVAGSMVSEGSRLVAPHRRGIGFVFQNPALWPHMKVADQVRFGLHGWPMQEAEARVAHLLKRFSLEDCARRKPATLSGGEARRVSIARSMAPKPALLLLDEPMTHLDERLRDEAMSFLLEEATQSGTTLVMVTHEKEEALRLASSRLVWEGAGNPRFSRGVTDA